MNGVGLKRLAHLVGLLMAAIGSSYALAASGSAVQARIDADIARGAPIVVHVVVALCDNANQGIVPVPAALGHGQEPNSNLYWGALYGLRTHFARVSGWARLQSAPASNERILDRVVFHASERRGEVSIPVYVIADAWDGAEIREALRAYLEMAAGKSAEAIVVTQEPGSIELHAGGSSHLLAYVGHNGLMEFSLDTPCRPGETIAARSAVVLACASRSYFLDHLEAVDAHPLLLTMGLMAPEAYTLDAAIRAWIGGRTIEAVIEAAATAYNRYQKCGVTAARRLFWGAP